MTVEEYHAEVFEIVHVQPPKHDRKDGIMDQATHDKIVSFVRGIEANLGSRSHLTPGSRTHSADPKKSKSTRWRR
jgi:hypothetical protein